LSGILLLKAEALNDLPKNRNPHKALELVNKVRAARGLNKHVDESIRNKTKVRDIILTARQFELFAEGHRFFDLVRNGVAVSKLPTLKDSLSIYWPVSQNVLNRNPDIQQTKGY
jgi:hypothetical protein